MSLTRALCRASRTAFVHCKNSLLLSPPSRHQQQIIASFPHFNQLRSYGTSYTKESMLQRLLYSGTSSQRFGLSTSASPDKESGQDTPKQDNNTEVKVEDASGDADAAEQKQDTSSDSEQDIDDFTKEELWKIANGKEQELNQALKEVASAKDTVLRTYAEMENVRERMKRESENAKKFAIQNFAKSLLDVADNLERASSVVKESFSKIDTSEDPAGAVPLLKTLLEGVAMTEKQLAEVFRKYGVEKHDPTNEPFDPNLHNAIFQVPDNSKPPNTVAVVLKPGYALHDRIIRPAEVGVTQAVEGNDTNQSSEA